MSVAVPFTISFEYSLVRVIASIKGRTRTAPAADIKIANILFNFPYLIILKYVANDVFAQERSMPTIVSISTYAACVYFSDNI